jgi:hypothetical protein
MTFILAADSVEIKVLTSSPVQTNNRCPFCDHYRATDDLLNVPLQSSNNSGWGGQGFTRQPRKKVTRATDLEVQPQTTIDGEE